MIDITLSLETRLLTTASVEAMLDDGLFLPTILDRIVKVAEAAYPGAICSVLLLDPTGRLLINGASPSLPKIYSESIEGLEIGPGIGCCGTAAATRKRVVVEDVLDHPNWRPFRDLVRIAGFRSSASEPIISSDGQKVLGTFALYHAQPTLPTDAELGMMAEAALLARVAIEGADRKIKIR